MSEIEEIIAAAVDEAIDPSASVPFLPTELGAAVVKALSDAGYKIITEEIWGAALSES